MIFSFLVYLLCRKQTINNIPTNYYLCLIFCWKILYGSQYWYVFKIHTYSIFMHSVHSINEFLGNNELNQYDPTKQKGQQAGQLLDFRQQKYLDLQVWFIVSYCCMLLSSDKIVYLSAGSSGKRYNEHNNNNDTSRFQVFSFVYTLGNIYRCSNWSRNDLFILSIINLS